MRLRLWRSSIKGEVYKPSWEQEYSVYSKWYTEQDGDETVIYANFQGKNPNEEKVDINVRRNCHAFKDRRILHHLQVDLM